MQGKQREAPLGQRQWSLGAKKDSDAYVLSPASLKTIY